MIVMLQGSFLHNLHPSAGTSSANQRQKPATIPSTVGGESSRPLNVSTSARRLPGATMAISHGSARSFALGFE